jgi:hypothetical protein
MDENTYRTFSGFAVENKNKRKELPYLLSEERNLYEFLIDHNKRLEQERISQQFVQVKLQ